MDRTNGIGKLQKVVVEVKQIHMKEIKHKGP